MIRYDKSEEARERRRQKHKCSGDCYGNPCCLEIDICEETRLREFLGTVASFLLCVLVGVAILVGSIVASCFIVDWVFNNFV